MAQKVVCAGVRQAGESRASRRPRRRGWLHRLRGQLIDLPIVGTTTPRARTTSALIFALLLLAGCTTLKRCAYEGLGRDSWQHPEQVIQTLALRAGDRVADLGSGGGYFTFRLAAAVGPAGKVYAVDIDAAMNADLRGRASRDGYTNVEVILAKPDDPLLPLGAIDVIFTSNTYHHLKDRAAYFTRVKKYLKPDGRIAVIDFDRRGWTESLGHYTEPETIKAEMRAAGYRLAGEHTFLPKQSFLVFSPGGVPP